jgi:MSHA biogenesis protein MshM
MLALENPKEKQPVLFPAVNQNGDSLFGPHFGLRNQPFVSNMDRNRFFEHESALEVLNTLQYALRSGEGVTKITGESGTGKTYLVSNLLSTMTSEFFVIKILNPSASPKTLLQSILDELCVEYDQNLNNQQLMKLIFATLCVYYANFKAPVVISVDNAERLSVSCLAAIASLNNLETQHRKLIQTVLIGTQELDEKLRHQSLSGLRQRISFNAELKALSKKQTLSYIKERVEFLGEEKSDLFTRGALSTAYKYTRGIPRLVNLVCYKAMMLAYGEGKLQVCKKHVSLAAEDTQQIRDVEEHTFPRWGYLPFFLAFVGIFSLVVAKIIVG